ncbi:SIS domain-containing protein [Paracoccus gahaiensis]|uniref:SIS domain-containing protein n=1 Tax=Paracoccus gahaiensis TaxID=1706839 RepID=A0A4U0R5I9_9RHOB|nr:SIS domain-containing protein [Paracoccus gahaiensis]TJZ90179.1 SIS domain-containing protein [Paracoccus gahaiensis]
MTPADSHALLLRELSEQADVISAAALQMNPPQLDRKRPVWIGGCGDSLFAAQALAIHFQQLGLGMRPCSAAEMLWDAPITAEDTVVGISISGSTRRTVEALSAASAHGARTIAVTLGPQSPLASVASEVVILPYKPISRAIPHGLDYQITLLALGLLAGPVDKDAIAEMLRETWPQALQDARAVIAQVPAGARFVFLGGGAALGTAGYGAAKLHEAGGLTAFAFEAENFAHGAQYMLRAGDHVVLCASGGRSDPRTFSMQEGLAEMGATVSMAGTFGAAALDQDGLHNAMRAALDVQCLCLALAEARSLDVTDPGQGSPAAKVQRDWFSWQSP